MFQFLLFVAMPLLILSVALGWWAHKKDNKTAYKVLVAQLMIDSLLIAFFLMIFFEQFSLVFLFATVFYAAITSLRLREFFSKVDYLIKTGNKSQNPE